MRKLFFVLSLLLAANTFYAEEARLLRFPSVSGESIVFTYAGDLYLVNKNGGIARKITTGEGNEMFARFSNDGSQIAFTGQYDGNTEVYTIPAEGGVPERITYTATLGRDDVSDRMGPNNIVMGWTTDDEQILFRSRMREFNSFKGKLYTVRTDGSMPDEVPLPRGGFASYSPDGKKLAYNRVFREFRTWKGYRGGMADDIWIYDFETRETKKVTSDLGQDIIPVWLGDNIYFASDRDGRMNLFVYETGSGQVRKLTDFKEFDVKFPSGSGNSIVFENGGYIYLFDTVTEQYNKVDIEIADDMAIGRGGLTDVKKNIQSYEISNDGKRAMFVARGDIFTVPAEEGITYNLTESPGVFERNAKWSPDGKYIAYISDKSGEDEIYVLQPDKPRSEVQLTTTGAPYMYELGWSPDSKKILYDDRDFKLNMVDVESKKVTTLYDSETGEIGRFSWSPDSRYAAFSASEYRGVSRVYIYALEEEKVYPVTGEWYDSMMPEFSDNGKYLYFESARDFDPIYSWTEWNHAYRDMNSLYLVTLNRDILSPLLPKNEEKADKEEDKKDENDKEKSDKKEEAEKVKIDFDGIGERIVKLPLEAANHTALQSAGDNLYYVRRKSGDKPTLYYFDFEKKKETELGNYGGFEISADNKKMLVGSNGSYYIIPLPTSTIKPEDKLNLDELQVVLDRKAEWTQIFNQAWRQMRDFFYVPNMHGVNWEAIRAKYEPLVEYVNNRIDLTYIIGEMIGELNAGHAYVGGGDTPDAERIKTGLLGAQFEKDDETGYFRIEKIFKGANWSEDVESPLRAVGLNIHESDYIIAINNYDLKKTQNIYSELIDKAGKEVKLTINSTPEKEGARDVIVEPIGDESELYYLEWVNHNIDKVNKATDGKVGYIHIPDMGPKGLNEFVKHFYPQLAKEGLIIDVRGNGGGNVSPMLIERLRREAIMVGNRRGVKPTPDPSAVHLGPQVALMDEFSASDGDIFPYRFKKNNLGTLIGKRSWGGVVGIAGSRPFMDNGYVMTPEFGLYNIEGSKWIIEGHGVEPDIVVDNDPALEYDGTDQQLNKAIEVILEQLKTDNPQIPHKPDYPVKKID